MKVIILKKVLAISLLVFALTGCSKTESINDVLIEETKSIKEVEHNAYIVSGRYYINENLQGKVVTCDGNVWDYTQDIISEELSYNNEPVFVALDDNGTPDVIEDDIVMGVVLDRETVIYDVLEETFTDVEGFNIERTGNNIRISLK